MSPHFTLCPDIPCGTSEYVNRFATKEAADAATENEDEDGEDEEMSDIGSISDDEQAMEQ